MAKNGTWIAIASKIKTIGFDISELYSTWSTWSDMALNFLEPKKNHEILSCIEKWGKDIQAAAFNGAFRVLRIRCWKI